MILESWTKKEALFIADRKDMRGACFLIDIEKLPNNPEPRKIVVEFKWGKKKQIYTMRWRDFLNQTSMGGLAMLHHSDMKLTTQIT